MNRSPMPRGGKPLTRRGGLQRTAGLTTTTPLARTAGIRPVSAKRARQNRQRRAMARSRYPDQPLCAWPGPPHWAEALHEIKTRARGGSITDEQNTLPMCHLHNGMLSELTGSELVRAEQAGLLKHSWEAA